MNKTQNPQPPDRDPHEALRTSAWQANAALQLFVREFEKCARDPEKALALGGDLLEYYEEAKDLLRLIGTQIDRLICSSKEVIQSPSLALAQ